MFSSFLPYVAPVIAISALVAGLITYLSTKGIQKGRIDGLEDLAETSSSNVTALREAMRIQNEEHNAARKKDREECDQQIGEAQATASHALSEASAARSEAIGAVTEAVTKAVLSMQREAVEKASAALASGQRQIIDKLDHLIEVTETDINLDSTS